MALSPAYLFGMSVTVFVTAAVVIAAVRWWHMCRPFDRNPGYYYPARPFMVAVHLNALMLLPAALAPESADAFYLARLFFLPVALLHFTLMLFAYFGSVMQWRKWRTPVLVTGVPVAQALLAAFVVAVWPGDWMVQGAMPFVGRIVFYSLGLIMTGAGITAIWVVRTWAMRFNEDEFSNPADFPVRQARLWTMLIAVNLVLCWTGALAESRTVLSVVILILAAVGVLTLISALHPHRYRQMEQEEAAQQPEAAELPSGEAVTAAGRTLSSKRRLDVLSAIITVVEELEAYLDPHLTLQDVAERSGYNRTYVSSIIKEEFGGFFNYINRLRLQHVEDWQKEHPDGTLQDAILESGFNSRQAFYSAKSRLDATA